MATKRICVFCGSRVGGRPEYAAAARELGERIGAAKLGLVYGGGNIGLMGVLADAALAAGAEVIGVIPSALQAKELAHAGLSELLIVNSMHERKAKMADLSDAFVALPGGYGTLDEFFEILTWAQLGIHAKPVGLLNVADYFTPLLLALDHMTTEQFVWPRHRRLFRDADQSDQLLDRLLNSPAPTRDERWLDAASR